MELYNTINPKGITDIPKNQDANEYAIDWIKKSLQKNNGGLSQMLYMEKRQI